MTFVKSKNVEMLPMYVPPADWLDISDVHLGMVSIYKTVPGVLFCDIDGTVADLAHRRHFVRDKPKNWPAFERAIPFDTPIAHVIAAVRELSAAGWIIVMCSGRGMQSKAVTETWLIENGVPYDAIYMRAAGDYRADNIIKAELLAQARMDGYDPDVVFDDRNQVVEMWRAHGIPCVQVAFGDF